ncbi:MAG: metallophosphoesterase family protein [Rhodomicrobium sp.]|nr:metallophosphoesterase family protein [Rhodomicrobium sp.]
MRARAEGLRIPPSHVICTGDVVAYCAEPEATVRLIRDWGCHVIKGNCEEKLAAREADCGCGFADGTACDLLSRGWYAFADGAISGDSRAWMASLPAHLTFELAGRTARVIHGGVSETSRFIFASTPAAEKRAELAAAGADIVIGGHCGLPFIQRLGVRIWFNPGVIGMPANDGTRDGWFGLIEPQKDGVRFRIERLAYDAATAAARLREAGFAAPYADALIGGLWPDLDILPKRERAATGVRLADTALDFRVSRSGLRSDHPASKLRQSR